MRPKWTRSPRPSAPEIDATQQPRVPREHGAWRVERAIAGFRRSGDRSDQVPARSRRLQGEPTVSQGELEQVVQEYRRVHEEHRRAPARGRTRRHLEVRLQELRARFDRLLAEAPVSTADRRHWRNRLRGKEAVAPPPGDLRPLVYRGRSGSGSEIRLRATPDGTVETQVDGAAVAVLDRADELLGTTSELIFALNGMQFHETFGASPSCLADLRDAEESGRRPRPRYVKALIEDGLVDRTLGLTARGRRALALDRAPARHAEAGIEPAISIRGSIPSRARENLARALVRVAGVAPQPVLHITASLDRHEDPALDRPFVAKATLDVNGRAVHAHVAAASVSEAIHLLEARLHRKLRALAEHDLAERRDRHLPEAGEWRHGDRSSPRPSYFDRP
jgi:ribosome-associated translation inhibitor RaiA